MLTNVHVTAVGVGVGVDCLFVCLWDCWLLVVGSLVVGGWWLVVGCWLFVCMCVCECACVCVTLGQRTYFADDQQNVLHF